MNSLSNLMAAVVVLCAGAAVAETYEGVQPLTTERVRADVVLEAMAAAAAPNPYEEGASSGVAPALRSPTERAIVQREAVDAAHAPNQNLNPIAFFNSTLPSQFNGSAINTRLADEATDTGSAGTSS